MGSSNVTRQVVITTSGGTLTAAADSSVGQWNAATAATITLQGTEAALSQYLSSAAGNLRFNGAAAGSYKLDVTVQTVDGITKTRKSSTLTVRALPLQSGSATSPAILTLPAELAIVSGVSSELAFTGADLASGTGNDSDSLVMTLGVSAGDLSATSAGGVVVGGTQTARTLTGTASALEAFLQAGSVSYLGGATTLSVTLTRSDGSKVRTTASLNQQTPTAAAAPPALTFATPSGVTTTAGAVVPITFGAPPLAAPGPVTLTFTASGGASLRWLSDSVVQAPVGSAAGNGKSVSLYGSPEALNAYLAGGKLLAGGAGSVTGSGDASGTITVSAQSGNTAEVRTVPALSLPTGFTPLSANGQIVLDEGALGTGSNGATDTRTVVLSMLDANGVASTSATLTATGLDGRGLQAFVVGSPTAVTAGATGATATLTLVGTQSALSTYLSTAGRVNFNGVEGSSCTLRVSVSQTDGAAVVTETVKVASVLASVAQGRSGAAAAPAVESLPESVQITVDASSALKFAGALVDDGTPTTDETLTLTLSVATPSTGVRSLSATSGGNVTVTGTGTTSLTLSGNAADLQAFLRDGPITYAGDETSLVIEVSDAAGGKASMAVTLTDPAHVAVARLSGPAAVTTTPGALVAIPFDTESLVAPGPVTLTFTASGGASLRWLSDAQVLASSGASSGIAAGSGTAVTLYGMPAALNAYLAGGKLEAGGAGAVTVAGDASATILVSELANT